VNSSKAKQAGYILVKPSPINPYDNPVAKRNVVLLLKLPDVLVSRQISVGRISTTSQLRISQQCLP